MHKQTQKPKRKAAVVLVPDLRQDAAERKRLLNVLAQRRYRERKRDHLKKLESQVESSTSPLTGDVHADSAETVQNNPKQQWTHSCRTSDSQPSEELPGLDIAATYNVLDGLGDPVFTSAEWAEPFDSSMHTWPAATLLPSLFPSPITSPSTITSGSDQTTDTATSPTSLDSADWPPIHEMDFASALQATSIRSYTFPDERHTSILELKLLRGCMTIAQRLNIEDLLWSLDAVSPFTDPALLGLSFDHLPVNLRPTATQQLIPHHPILDIIAWPTMRDKLILVFSQPPEVRPPIATSSTALVNLVYDIEDSAEGVRIWGEDPCNAENWEAGEVVFSKWWWALDSSIIGKSNEWRMERGAPLLGAGEGFVVGEV